MQKCFSIAIIGSGITGISAAWHLHPNLRVFIFEKNNLLGGHTHTHSLDFKNKIIHVDSGFIVFNKINYPNFTKWLCDLGVKYCKSDMSFSFSLDKGKFEWGGRTPISLFGQTKNIFSPAIYSMIRDILKFNKVSKRFLSDDYSNEITIENFLERYNFGIPFKKNYLLPMAASIWSTPTKKILEYPAKNLIVFFKNHGLLSIFNHHQWYSIEDGSNSYIKKFINYCKKNNISLLTKHEVKSTIFTGKDKKVLIKGINKQDNTEFSMSFDAAFFACHPDQSTKIISQDISIQNPLNKIKYQTNTGYLHCDESLMPKRKVIWASWNYLSDKNTKSYEDKISLTYWMNKLQKLKTKKNIFVTLNSSEPKDKTKIFKTLRYEHPIFDSSAINAVEEVKSLQGKNNFWFGGAWMGNGFHEDGFISGKTIAHEINKRFL